MSEIKTLNSGEKIPHASIGSPRNLEGNQFVKYATGTTLKL